MKITGTILVSENFGHINGHKFCSDQYFFMIQKDVSS